MKETHALRQLSAFPIVTKCASNHRENGIWNGRLILLLLLQSVISVFLGGHSLALDADKNRRSPGSDATELQSLDSVSQYGITWKFSQKVPVGKFVSGDYYVVGPVTITAIDPKPLYGEEVPEKEREKEEIGDKVATSLRNGFMLNPPPRQEMAYDSGMRNYYRPKLTQRLPVTMQPGDSLVSTVSLLQGEEAPSMLTSLKASRHSSDASPVKAAAVLTCVAAPQPADAFRPSYCDRKGKVYLARNLKRNILPALAIANLNKICNSVAVLRSIERPWVHTGFFGFDRPVENMPGYGQQVAQAVELSGLLLCTNLPAEEKESILIHLVQVGIDLGGVVRAGHPGWEAFGGHGSGCKFPIVLAGLLLGDDELANINKTCPRACFGEDEQTAYGNCWTGAKVVFTGHRGIDEATGKGRAVTGPYEHKHPSEWTGIAAGPYRMGDRCSESYRRANTSGAWIGQALVLHLLKAETTWNHDAFFDYCDRWMFEEDDAFRVEIGKSYIEHPPVEPISSTVSSGGHATLDLGKALLTRRPDGFNCEGFVWNRLAEEMWKQYRTMPGMPPTDGWKKPHDDSYYLNALKTAETKN